MVTDTVADSLIRIKNGYLARKESVDLQYSKLVKSICEILVKEGYIADLKVDGNKISVSLRYEGRRSVLTGIKRISKPGLRVYKGKQALPYVLNGLGIAIVSTPKGVMTDKEARKAGLGGEVMAFVW